MHRHSNTNFKKNTTPLSGPNNRSFLNIGTVICLIAGTYIIYSMMLSDDLLPFSIASFHSSVHHHMRHWHVIAVGLLPIYVAFVIFGTAVICAYMGTALYRWLGQFLNHK